MKKLILILIVCLLAGCGEKKAVEIAPQEMLGMEIMWMEQGEKALTSVEKSHIGNIMFVKDVAIIGYRGGGKSITLWITTYPNSTIAEEETERMARAMLHFEDWGVHLNRSRIDGNEVYTTLRDVRHYFWSDGRCMFYIVPKNLNQTEIERIIRSIECDSGWTW
jgi:hypothetical protein